MAKEACAKKRKGRKRKEGTSDLGSSSKMGQVSVISSLCLDYKEKRGEQKKRLKEKKKGGGGSAGLATRKPKKREGILKVTYSPLSSKCRIRSRLSLASSCSAGRGSICRWPWSSRLGLTCRLKLGRTFLTRCRNVCHFNFLLLAWRIITNMPIPPFLLLILFKDGRPVLLPSIC